MPRLTGKEGSIYLAGSGTKLGDSFNWEYEGMQDVLDASIKGENWKRYVADVGHGRVRVQCYNSTAGASEVTNQLTGSLVSAAGVGTQVDFVLHQIDGSAAVVTGTGYVTRSQLHVARDGMITDEIEIEIDGKPTVT